MTLVAALAVLLALAVLADWYCAWCDGEGIFEEEAPAPVSPVLAFIKEHALCQGQREFGVTDGGVRWAACPCGSFLEARRPPAVQLGPLERATGGHAWVP